MLFELVLGIVLAVSGIDARYNEETYSIPQPKIQVFKPRGFRVSIEDSPGIRLFAFHGNINDPLQHLEAGQFSKDILQKQDNKWTFEDKHTRLEVGDVMYYWLFVIKDSLGYRLDYGRFTVKEFTNSPFDDSDIEDTQEPPSKPHESKPGTYDPNEEKYPIRTTPIPYYERDAFLRICERTVLNATQALLSLQSQLDALRKTNEQLTNLIEIYPDGKKMSIVGRVPPEEDPEMTVRFILKEKLDLNPYVTSAVRNSDNSITFEVTTVADKLEILEAAKYKLKNSKFNIVTYIK